MEKQVGKSDVFTKISLVNIQDKMREYCISSFNRMYNLNYSLKDKEEGRNIDINVANMKDYNKFRKEQEKHKKQFKELNDEFEIDRGNTLKVFKSVGFKVIKELSWKNLVNK